MFSSSKNKHELFNSFISNFKDRHKFNKEKAFLHFIKDIIKIKGIELYRIRNNGDIEKRTLKTNGKVKSDDCVYLDSSNKCNINIRLDDQLQTALPCSKVSNRIFIKNKITNTKTELKSSVFALYNFKINILLFN